MFSTFTASGEIDKLLLDFPLRDDEKDYGYTKSKQWWTHQVNQDYDKDIKFVEGVGAVIPIKCYQCGNKGYQTGGSLGYEGKVACPECVKRFDGEYWLSQRCDMNLDSPLRVYHER